LFFRLIKLLSQTRISFLSSLIGISGIRIGRNCLVEAYCYLKSEPPSGNLYIENDVIIKRFSHLSAKNSKVIVQRHSYVGYNNWVGGKGNITIGENFISGMNVVIISSNHDYENIVVPYHSGFEIADDIVIGQNVWVGANSVILPGTSVGSGSVIAAGSIVSRNFPDNVLVAGAPAEIVKKISRLTGNTA
jgi:acetyltransferase-like isoleucine patch superfamily enzyme